MSNGYRAPNLWLSANPPTLMGRNGQLPATFLNTGTTLGLVPSWQFSPDPQVNALLNPNVYTPTAGMRLEPAPPPTLQGFGLPIVDSWWWKHRKPLAYGAIGLVGVAVIVTLTSL
jgi:hypothetical protein